MEQQPVHPDRQHQHQPGTRECPLRLRNQYQYQQRCWLFHQHPEGAEREQPESWECWNRQGRRQTTRKHACQRPWRSARARMSAEAEPSQSQCQQHHQPRLLFHQRNGGAEREREGGWGLWNRQGRRPMPLRRAAGSQRSTRARACASKVLLRDQCQQYHQLRLLFHQRHGGAERERGGGWGHWNRREQQPTKSSKRVALKSPQRRQAAQRTKHQPRLILPVGQPRLRSSLLGGGGAPWQRPTRTLNV